MADQSLRIDRWLWFARCIKTRTRAAALVQEGGLRINGKKIAKASHPVRPGDIVTLASNNRARVMHILKLGHRRGPASEAATLYREEPGDTSPAKRDASARFACYSLAQDQTIKKDNTGKQGNS